MGTKLEWGRIQGSEGQFWLAFAGPDDVRSPTLRVLHDRVVVQCGAERCFWLRDNPSLTDDVDAMRFAEDRARDLCARMFGDLVDVPKGKGL